MNSPDVIKVAKIFEQFIQLKSAVVKLTDISAIKQTPNGVEVITANGTFKDGEDFEKLITRIQDAQEVMKGQPASAIIAAPVQSPVEHQQTDRKVIPIETIQEPQQTVIHVGTQGAMGHLFGEHSTLEITDRPSICVLDPTGNIVLATAGEGSAVKGEKVSGYIHTNGKYTLSFQGYPHTEAIVSYTTKQKVSL